MSDIAIRVENLSKRYRIGLKEQISDTFAGALTSFVRSPFQNLRRLRRLSNFEQENADDILWALRDISFEVKQGEVIGIIGRNGAGKSTLLKILSRITEPTSGRIELHGRVASLLEVGTGFHPELTGRENIYLNGTVLGMTKREVDQKFDEIVDFSGIERFIDTPVKRYSSGMQVRLAFSVAAHLEPEILLVDEVLAVGDVEFQKRSLGQLDKVSQSGRTVLFVSHQMNQMRRLCKKGIWVDNGRIREVGDIHTIINNYEMSMTGESAKASLRDVDDNKTQFISWGIDGQPEDQAHTIDHFDPLTIKFVINIAKDVKKGHHGLVLYDNVGNVAWSAAVNDIELSRGIHELTYELPMMPLKPGAYQWFMTFYDMSIGMERVDEWYALPMLSINTPSLTHPNESIQGYVNFEWNYKGQYSNA